MVNPRKRVFISYGRKDAARLATMLQQGLQQDHDVWLDNNRIAGGATWTVKVEKAIDNCDVFLALLSPGSYVSDICRAEQLRALRCGKRLIPVPVVHGDLPVLGFRFGHAAYVTDFSAIPEATLPLLEDLDVLILDALRHKPHPTHSSLEQSLGVVERVQPRRAFFTHIAHELGHEESNAALPPHVRLAYDGLVLEL